MDVNYAKKIYAFILGTPEKFVPKKLKPFLDTERYSIDQFIRKIVVPALHPDDLLLDAGAGFGRFRKELSVTQYESCDFAQVFDQNSKAMLTFICSLDDIPKPDNTYDIIVNTQVLEHIEFPQRVINEFYRILKPGGKLYLTTNQTFMIHNPPYCFFFYTRYGLESLFKHAGFEVVSIAPRGGIFWVIGKFLSILPRSVFYQTCYDGFKDGLYRKPKLRRPFLALFLLPIFLVGQLIIGIILTLICFPLDRFDKQKLATLGYSCVCIKPANA